MRALLLSLCIAVVSICTAHAQSTADNSTSHLTSRSRIMLTGGVNISFANDSGTTAGGKRWSTQVSPGITYFLRERIGLGAFASLGYHNRPWGGDLAVGGGIQGMFDAPLSERVSLFVNPWWSVHWTRTSRPHPWVFADTEIGPTLTTDRQHASGWFTQLGVFLPIMLKLNAHLGLGIGPYATLDFLRYQTNDFAASFDDRRDEPAAFASHPGPFGAGSPRPRISTGLMTTIAGSF